MSNVPDTMVNEPPAAQPVAPPIVLAAPVFALAPALVDQTTFINYATRDGSKLFDQAVAKLSTTFDFEDSSELQALLDQIAARAITCGWSHVFKIDCQPDPVVVGNEVMRDLLTEYGSITEAHVLRSALSYVNGQTRKAQDGFNSYMCIYASLDTSVIKKLAPFMDSCEVSHDNAITKNGPLLLKCIISEIFVDTRATVTLIRTKLSKLDTKMVELNYNVEEFNLYVNTLLTNLAARGEKTQDLFTNLIKGYETVPDEKFKDLIERKRDAYEEGEDISEKMFMATAKAKYMARKQSELWNAPTIEQEQILALTAQIDSLKTKANSTTAKKTSDKASKKQNSSTKDSAWKKIAPKSGDSQTKTLNSNTYNWCPHHKQWTVHDPAECRLNPNFNDADDSDAKDSAGSKTKEKKVSWAKKSKYQTARAAAALLDSDDDEEDDEDEQE